MTTIVLPADSGIGTAADVRRELLAQVRHSEPLVLDGGQVRRVHSASLQLLCALFRERRELNLETRWSAASTPLRDAVRILGLAAALELSATGCTGACNDTPILSETSA